MNDVSLYGAYFSERGEGFRDMGGVTNYAAYARAVNDNRVVVGEDLSSPFWEERPYDSAPFRWTPKKGYQVLGSFGGRKGSAYDINNRGEIVGYSQAASGELHAFVWKEKRGMVDLGPGSAMAINDELPWIGGFERRQRDGVEGHRRRELAGPNQRRWEVGRAGSGDGMPDESRAG
jgi:probable HAF family extracellular repeat protein